MNNLDLTKEHLRDLIDIVYTSKNILWEKSKWGMNKRNISDVGYLCWKYDDEGMKGKYNMDDYEKLIRYYGLKNLINMER